MAKKKKSIVKILERQLRKSRLSRLAFLHLEKQVLLDRELFSSEGRLNSRADRYCLKFLALTFGLPSKQIDDQSKLNVFLEETRKKIKKLRKKNKK